MSDKSKIPESGNTSSGVSAELAEKIWQRWGVVYPIVGETKEALVGERGQAVAVENQTLPLNNPDVPIPLNVRATQQVDILGETIVDAALTEEAKAVQLAQIRENDALAQVYQIHREAA